jgi:3-oxoacyl-[acyl-carrier-protein] synthase-3
MGMVVRKRMGIRISDGIGVAFPPYAPVTNEKIVETYLKHKGNGLYEGLKAQFGDDIRAMAKAVGIDLDRIEKMTGFKNRYWTHWPGTCTTEDGVKYDDLIIKSCEDAIADAGLERSLINAFFLSFSFYYTIRGGATSSFIANELGLGNAAVSDINATCSGAVYGMAMASGFLSEHAPYILLASGETYSRVLNWGYLTSLPAVADGAAAIVMRWTGDEKEGILGGYLQANPQHHWMLNAYQELPITEKNLKEGYIVMGHSNDNINRKIFERSATEELTKAIGRTLEVTGLTGKDIDLFLPHQVNLQTILTAAKTFGITEDRVVLTIDKYANTGSSCTLIALKEALEQGRIAKGAKVLFGVMGAGITSAGMVVQF